MLARDFCWGSLGFFTHSFHRMKLELLLNKIFKAARSDVVLEAQVGAQELAVLHLEPGCIWGGSQAGRSVLHTPVTFFGSGTSDQELREHGEALLEHRHSRWDVTLLLTRTVHKLPIIGTAELLAAGGTATSFKGLSWKWVRRFPFPGQSFSISRDLSVHNSHYLWLLDSFSQRKGLVIQPDLSNAHTVMKMAC